MDRNTAELGPYIAKCFPTFTAPTEKVFNEKTRQRRPTLESNRTNRILLYPGTFNPPHQGHRALLCHAFQSSQDINTIAAIIIPGGNSAVRNKCSRNGTSTVFTKEERIRLWQGGLPHDWCWVYPGRVRDFSLFCLHLTEAITRDGFEVKFALLLGPDHISQLSCPTKNDWNCHEVIVSDISRVPDFLTWRNTLQKFDLYGPWKTVSCSEERAASYAKKIRGMLHGWIYSLAPTPFLEMFEAGNQTLNVVL